MKTYRTAKAVIYDQTGNVLLLRRSSTHPTQGLHMDLPGGIIEENEQPTPALLREIEEETGLKFRINDLKLVFTLTENYHGQNAVRLVYAASVEGSKTKINLSWEHDQFHWLSPAQAIKKLKGGRYTRKGLKYIEDNNLVF
jgi:ADP-ribose pyrophosphatase YjhB (NUDIX family)